MSKFPMALNVTDPLKNHTLTKIANTINKYHDTLLPIIAVVAAFGGTVFYLIQVRRQRAEADPSAIEVKSGHTRMATSRESVLADLPPENRKQIWGKLDYEDLLKLRLVSGFTKDDVENWVGVKMRINYKLQEQYEFSQKVGLRSCIITDLPSEVDPDFLLNPSLMLQLELIEKSPIDLNSLNNLLVPCVNLRKLDLHFLYSDDIDGISDIVLNSIRNMQHLEELKLFRISSQSPTLKSIQQIPNRNRFPVSTNLTSFEVEIPDLPEFGVAVWKYVLEKQTQLKTLTINFGCVHWQFIRKVIPKNPNLERISLDGICNLSPQNGIREAFDWRTFENCTNLKSFEVGCPRVVDSQEIDAMPGINFRRFPCANIEEFYVYNVEMSPEDVRRVYLEMSKLSSGSLNRIGEPGTEMAAEMFLAHTQRQVTEGYDWTEWERWIDIAASSLLGISIIAMVWAVSRRQPISEMIEDDEFAVWEQNHR